MGILGGFAVERQDLIRLRRSYSLETGPEHSAQGQDTNKAFGRASMPPKVIPVDLFLRSRQVGYRQLPHMQCLLRESISFCIMLKVAGQLESSAEKACRLGQSESTKTAKLAPHPPSGSWA